MSLTHRRATITVGRGRSMALHALSMWALLVPISAVRASDNSVSTLEVFALLAKYTSKPIGEAPPPPIVIKPKPPSLAVLRQQLASDEQTVAEWQTALTSAQSMLAFWKTQPPGVAQINVPQWTQAVATDEQVLASVQAQITQLLAQIAAAE